MSNRDMNRAIISGILVGVYLLALQAFRSFIIISFVAAVVPTIAIADNVSPWRTYVVSAGLLDAARDMHVRSLQATTQPDLEYIQPIYIKTHIRGQGVVEGRFTLRRNKNWSSFFVQHGRYREDPLTPLLLRGSLSVGRGSGSTAASNVVPAALSIINNKLRITFAGRAKGRRKHRRLFTIHATLSTMDSFYAGVTSLPASAVSHRTCASLEEPLDGDRTHRDVDVSEHTSTEQVPVRIATVSTDADPEWHKAFGAESNAEIARIIHIAESIYLRDFRVAFQIRKQHVYTDASPYTSSNADQLLSQFTTNPDNHVNLVDDQSESLNAIDLKHLFTGKDLSGSTVGIAYVGTLCKLPEAAYGLSQNFIRDANYLLFAHEIAHTFGASHDVRARGTIMFPSISLPPATQFSQDSLFSIRSFILRHGQCLHEEQNAPSPTPTPTPTKKAAQTPEWNLSLRQRVKGSSQRMVKFFGTLTTDAATPLPDIPINLLRNGDIIASTSTDRLGGYTFTLPARAFMKKRASMKVASEDGSVQSRSLVITPRQVRQGRR